MDFTNEHHDALYKDDQCKISPGCSQLPSTTTVTPNSEDDNNPLPSDHGSSTENFTLDFDNPDLFLTDDDDIEKRSLPGSPNLWDVFDNVIDVENNDVRKSNKGKCVGWGLF